MAPLGLHGTCHQTYHHDRKELWIALIWRVHQPISANACCGPSKMAWIRQLQHSDNVAKFLQAGGTQHSKHQLSEECLVQVAEALQDHLQEVLPGSLTSCLGCGRIACSGQWAA